MRSVSFTPAPFSLRALILIGVLAAPMLLWPRMSFAFPPYLSAPLSPAYLVCTNWNLSACHGYTVSGSPPTNSQYSFIGYVHTTQVDGTSPAYLVCTNWNLSACSGYTVSGSPPTNSQYWFIGYVYPTIPASKNFTVNPKYFIGSVFYVPPGAGASSIA